MWRSRSILMTDQLAAISDDELVTDGFKLGDLQFTTTNVTWTRGRPGEGVPVVDEQFDTWERAGEFIRLTNQASQWWWGDWLNLGEERFGERAAQALEDTRWEAETLAVYAWVCRKVPKVNRLVGVPFSHYLQLAKLDISVQKIWAEQAKSNEWSQRQLRSALKSDGDDLDSMVPCVLIRCADKKDAQDIENLMLDKGYAVERLERSRKR